MAEELSVFLNQSFAGLLRLDASKRFSFQYNDHWLANVDAKPLSVSLPLSDHVFEDDKARPFFTGILPEAQLLEKVSRKLGISEKNSFGLLKAIGGECAGAVSIPPQGQSPESAGRKYQPISDRKMAELVKELPARPLMAGTKGVRLSLAGAQDKLPVKFEHGRFYLPLEGSPSTHIIKTPIPNLPNTVENEAFCMTLARDIGLNVPEVEIRSFGGVPVLIVERYDRLIRDETVQRVHQEDFCQALAIMPENKYENEGGPGFPECFELVRKHCKSPAKDLKMILKWAVFNFLIGNADAHAKNIALLYSDKAPELAPFYDLISTLYYGKIFTNRMAMKPGHKERRLQWIMPRHWMEFAERVGIAEKAVMSELRRTSKDIQQRVEQYAEGDYAGLPTFIGERAKKIITGLNEFKCFRTVKQPQSIPPR